MSEKLPPVPQMAPIADQSSIITPVWSDWFKQAFARMGGHLGTSNDWDNSLSASGYQKAPNGLMLQWGATASLSSGTTTTITLPATFPTGCLQVIPGISGNSASSTTATGHYGTGNYTATTFDLYNRTSLSFTFNWLAIGY